MKDWVAQTEKWSDQQKDTQTDGWTNRQTEKCYSMKK